jgi:hypothetical protein
MSTLFGAVAFLVKLYADSGYQGPKFQDGLAAPLPPHQREDRPTIRYREVRGVTQTLDRRKNHRMAQPMSPLGQGLGMPQPQRSCVPALGFRPPDGQKALSNPNMIPDGL